MYLKEWMGAIDPDQAIDRHKQSTRCQRDAHSAILKSIGLIGLIAASVLLCAQAFHPAPQLYRAKPENVPLWAEQGNVLFIRLDGGQI